MTPPPIKTIRRLALAGVVVMTVIVAATYFARRWSAEQARRALSAPIEEGVQQQAEKFTFSRSQEGQTLFTVDADRSTERAGKTTVLENVVVHIYGRHGERNDEIRTARCEYDAGGTQRIVCPGEVVVLLGNPRQPETTPESSIRLTTTALQFDPTESVAWTDEPIRFLFPGGSGQAVGLRYQATEPRVQFQDQVNISVSGLGEKPVQIAGSRLEYFAGTRIFELAPPLRLAVAERSLVADRLRMELDERFRTRRLEAVGHARAVAPQDGRRLTMTASRAVADYMPNGRIEKLRATGQVEFQGTSLSAAGRPTQQQRLSCSEAVFFFEPSPENALERVVASDEASLTFETSAETRTLRAPELELRLRGVTRDGQRLAVRGRGKLTVESQAGGSRTITADTMQLQLDRSRRLRALSATGQVETRSASADGSLRTSTSDQLRARFADNGALAALEQWGGFRYRDARWQAQAGRADYSAAEGKFLLQEQPVVWDASSRTSAGLIEIFEGSRELRARGEVRSILQTAAGFGSGEPVKLAAERLQASAGHAVYQGQARLWQGENRLAAAKLELQQDPARLQAAGEVTAVFLEAARGGENAEDVRSVRISSDRFQYVESQRRGDFDGSVRAHNDFGTLSTPHLEVFLAGESGAAGLERARASGGVRLEEGGVQATSEQGEYRADNQTVVLWGGTPTLHHPERGVTTGARLTLFLADATISIDSAEGTRTVTRRPWSQ
jgi:lipopolysaccharide export system protein LptA